GSGAEGRLTKQDVLAYLEQRGSAPAQAAPVSAAPVAQPVAKAAPVSAPRLAAQPVAASGDGGSRVEVIKMDRMRQLIAEHMTRSKATSAHVTSFAEIDVTNLVTLRERQKQAFQQREGVKLTYTPFFVKASVDALRSHPLLNASVQGKEVIVKKDFHIGIAVAIGTKGLLVPIVRDAGQKNVAGLAQAVADLATRARNKQLLPDELQGGTFTVTNVGSLGSLMGTPIINQPQVAILSPGAITKRPVVVEDPTLGDVIAIRHMMYVSLSYDHRIIDGAMAASFLRAYRATIETLDPNGEV
ncbi:MAG: dihydrolipoamide acetyltransferase family protein, partial [Bacteroidota bacterium]